MTPILPPGVRWSLAAISKCNMTVCFSPPDANMYVPNKLFHSAQPSLHLNLSENQEPQVGTSQSVCLPACLSVCLPATQPVCPSASACLSVTLSVRNGKGDTDLGIAMTTHSPSPPPPLLLLLLLSSSPPSYAPGAQGGGDGGGGRSGGPRGDGPAAEGHPQPAGPGGHPLHPFQGQVSAPSTPGRS